MSTLATTTTAFHGPRAPAVSLDAILALPSRWLEARREAARLRHVQRMDAEVTAILAANGGVLTDEVERRIVSQLA